MRDSGEALVDSSASPRASQVLDLGCGDGTTALPAAQLGADVLGVDIAQQPGRGRQRASRGQGLANCRFQEGDAIDLTALDDDSFDLVVSIFGAMFAPKPFDVAKEMVRVTRPGGRIVMGNWIPGDPTLVAQILKISSAYSPPPPEGFVSPMTWGVERTSSSVRRARACPRTGSLATATRTRSITPAARSSSPVPHLLRTHHERVRRGRGERPRPRTCRRESRQLFDETAKQERRCHARFPGDLPARHGHGLDRAAAPRRRSRRPRWRPRCPARDRRRSSCALRSAPGTRETSRERTAGAGRGPRTDDRTDDGFVQLTGDHPGPDTATRASRPGDARRRRRGAR